LRRPIFRPLLVVAVVATTLPLASVPVTADSHIDLAIADVTVGEEEGTAVLTVTASPTPTSDVSVNYATSNGSATAPADYSTRSGTATITAGMATTTIAVPVIDDNTDELDETFGVALSSPVGASLADGSATVTIVDDDPMPVLSVGDVREAEGDSGTRDFFITVELDRPSSRSVSFKYSTRDGTAERPTDYVENQGSRTLAPGETSFSFGIRVKGDTDIESDEYFDVVITDVVNALPGDLEGRVTIDNDDEAASVADASGPEGDTGSTPVAVRVSLNDPVDEDVTFDWATQASAAPNAATPGVDYQTASGTVTIPTGQVEASFDVTILGDTVDDGDEVFEVLLSNPTTGITLTDPVGVVTIRDDDEVSLRVEDAAILEGQAVDGQSQLVFDVVLTGGTAVAPVTFDFATSNLDAVAGSDYQATSGSGQIDAGSTDATISVAVTGDDSPEGFETFRLTLTNITNASVDDAVAVGTIHNDDTALSIDDVQVSEGNDGGTVTATFTVTSSHVSALAASASFATSNVSAVAPADYQHTSGTVVVPAGQDDASVAVTVVSDTIDEPDETYAVTLSNPTNAVILDGTGSGTIADDAPPAVNIGDVTRVEGDAGTVAAVLSVNLSSASGRQVTVDYACLDGSASAPDDYTHCSGTLTYQPGQTSKNVAVHIVGDTLQEGDESFFVVLSNEVNVGLADGTGRVTITDDDAADEPPSVEVASSQAVETAALATFSAAADDPDSDSLTVTWAFGDGSASVVGNPIGHRYDAPGTYDAEVSVSDGTSTTTESFNVTATDSGLVTRSSGDDRIATAVDASMDHWPAGSATDALLARADKFPDALAAGPLAAELDAPLLLTSSDTLPAIVEAELARLDVDRVWLLGGETSLTPALAQRLQLLGYELVRRAGQSRFDTAAAIAREVGRTAAGEVVLALGSHPIGDHRAFPDALSAGSLSASPQRLPLVLTETADLPEATVEALEALKTTTVWIVGGESSVQPAVATRLQQLGYVVRRLSGDTRYLTSVAVAQEAMRRAPAGQVRLVVATGEKFPDGLAGGGVAARVDGILLLVPDGVTPDDSSAFLTGEADRFDQGVVLGGTNTLSEAVRVSVHDLIDR